MRPLPPGGRAPARAIQALLLHPADEEAKHQETLRKLYAELAAGRKPVEGLNLDRTLLPASSTMKLGRVNSNLKYQCQYRY